MKRVVVVSHASVIKPNQLVYARLRRYGWEPLVVAPSRWRNEYGPVRPEGLPELDRGFVTKPVLLAGRPQRHVYLTRAAAFLRKVRPDVVFVDEEPFSVPGFQWMVAARRAGIPAGIRTDENLDRALPAPARVLRRFVLPGAHFVVARTPRAAALATRFGARAEPAVVPYAVPDWEPLPRTGNGRFTIGYAGRLVAEKGVRDLVAAARLLEPPVRLLFAGDGPLRDELAGAATPEVDVRIVSDLGHERMIEAYAGMDLLVLPSRTTAKWMEQFGRVLIEALSCGVATIGSDSGSIPWVIEQTGGGLIFPEGDPHALADRLRLLRDDAALRDELARRGGETVRSRFGVDAVAAELARVLDRTLEETA